MEYIDKANILVEFTQDFFTTGDYDDFFDYNDLGIPMALALTQDMIILTKDGEELLEETWADLCKLFDADPKEHYDSFYDFGE